MSQPYEYCTFRYSDGRQCRAPQMPTRSVCISHWKHDGQFNEDEEAVTQLAVCGGTLSTPAKINRALAGLWRLTALGKVPLKKASLLAYVGHLLLCSLPHPRGKAAELPATPERVEDAVEAVMAGALQAPVEPVMQMLPVEPGRNGSNGSGSSGSGSA